MFKDIFVLRDMKLLAELYRLQVRSRGVVEEWCVVKMGGFGVNRFWNVRIVQAY